MPSHISFSRFISISSSSVRQIRRVLVGGKSSYAHELLLTTPIGYYFLLDITLSTAEGAACARAKERVKAQVKARVKGQSDGSMAVVIPKTKMSKLGNAGVQQIT
jgi:hypothetical protein